MKTTVKLMAMATAMVALASCGTDSVYNPNAAYENAKAQYEKAFESKYGKVAPNQDWGFGTVSTKAETRGAVSNGNQWGDFIEKVPAPVTGAEAALVEEWFAKNKDPKSESIDYSMFFVQQVNYSSINSQMNEMKCGSSMDENDLTHIERFNNGQGSPYGNVWNGELKADGQHSEYSDRITLMDDSSTKVFTYKNSTDGYTYGCGYRENDGPIQNESYQYFVIIPGETIDKSLAGSYYVGFDYDTNRNSGKGRDGLYNDWIIRVTPAKVKYAKRIICEDLGATGDFDFNDVVFDAVIVSSIPKTYIKLLAAGGTLPLTVAGKEVHEAFGVSQSTMVNTGRASAKEVEFSVKEAYMTNWQIDYNAIPVIVESKNAESTTNYELTAEVGEVPQKIAVDTDYTWCTETESIESRYKKFSEWVGNPSLQYGWYK